MRKEKKEPLTFKLLSLLAICFLEAGPLFCPTASAQGLITTVAGGGGLRPGLAVSSLLPQPVDVVKDSSGNLFILSLETAAVYKVDSSGQMTVVVGTGQQSSSPNGVKTSSASLNFPLGIAIDGAGNLFIADSGPNVVRRVDASTGIITIVAGSPFSAGFSGDGGPATSATLNHPGGVAVDSAGNLFIGDTDNQRVRRVDAGTGIITTVAGNGTAGFSGDGGLATNASLNFGVDLELARVAVDSADNLFIADDFNFRIRRVDASTGFITTVAGSGSSTSSGDGGLATTAGLAFPRSLAVDSIGNLFIGEASGARVRKVDAATKLISTIAGNGTQGFSGDGGSATNASLAFPEGVAVDSAGNVFIADTNNNRTRQVNTSQIISTVAGNGSVGDGGPATSATLFFPEAVAVDRASNLYIGASSQVVRRVDALTGVITHLAGVNDFCGFNGDGIPASSAQLCGPLAVAVDGSANVFVADAFNHRVRRVDAVSGIITTVAGNGTAGFSGDGGSATDASLALPSGVALDSAGDLFIADQDNNRIRRVDAATGIITTVAGNGTAGFSGDGGLATNAELNLTSPFGGPIGLAVDGTGNLFFSDVSNSRVRRVDGVTGVITTVAGSSTSCNPALLGDGARATSASLCFPQGVVVDPTGILYIADNAFSIGYQRIRRVDAATGVITTVAGGASSGLSSGDGGPATSASFSFLRGLALSGANSLFIADANGQRIRRVLFASTVFVGLPAIPSNGNCIPFGCPAFFGTTTYQQVYASSALPGVVNISGIDFLNTQFLNDAVPAGGTYALSLSYTSKSPGALDLTNPANNVTSGSQAFFTGTLPSISDGVMAFSGTPFAYNPALGNLLLTVQISGGVDSSPHLFLDFSQTPSAQTGRAFFGTVTGGNDGGGLVTAFITSSISSPPEPIVAGQPTTFTFSTSNQVIQYPSDAVIPPGTTMVATATTLTAAQFLSTRLAGSQFFSQNPNTQCIVYPDSPASSAGSCVVFEDKCFDSNMNPVTCPTTNGFNPATGTPHNSDDILIFTTINNLPSSSTSTNPASLPTNPGLITADDNQNDWFNIFLSMFVTPAPTDPTTIKGGTNGFNSDFVAVDLGVDPSTQAGLFQGFLQPLAPKNARVFNVGNTIAVRFQVKNAAGGFVTNATARLSVVFVGTTPAEQAVSPANLKGISPNQFKYNSTLNRYEFYLNTTGYAPGFYNLTVFSNSFPAQFVTFQLVTPQ